MSAVDASAVVGALCASLGIAGGVYRWALPAWRVRRDERREQAKLREAMRDVLIGRPAGESNPVTGEPGTPALPSIGDRINSVADRVTELHVTQTDQIATMKLIADEVRNNNASRITALEDVTNELVSQMKHVHRRINDLVAGNFDRREKRHDDTEPGARRDNSGDGDAERETVD